MSSVSSAMPPNGSRSTPTGRRTPLRVTPQYGAHGRHRRTMLALLPALIALAVGVLAYDGVRRAEQSRLLVEHTRTVIDRAHRLLSTMQDAETGQRGFVITGESSYLLPHDGAVIALAPDTAALRALTRELPLQQARMDTLENEIRAKMAELAETIELRKTAGFEAATGVVKTDRGRRSMDSIRRLIAHMIATEQEMLHQREMADARRGVLVTYILLGGTLLAVASVLFLNGILLRFAEAESSLAADLDGRNIQLEEQGLELELQAQQVQEQATELEMQNEELRATTDSLTAMSVQLRDQATELELQTEELTQTNHALGDQIREAQSAREDADAANRAKSEFLAIMSHELRTPLNAIAGYTQLMQLGVPEPIPVVYQDYLARIRKSQHHLLGVINSVLNFARIEAGAVVYDITDVEVATLLASVEPLIAPQARTHGHAYVCDPCDRSLVVKADEDKALQILLNLLSNAIKFTPSAGHIKLAAESATNGSGQRMVALRVTDTGTGIAADKLTAIFDPFVQIDTSHTRTVEGTGLGLAISRDLARGMDGDLIVVSTVGAGSTFSLLLPAA